MAKNSDKLSVETLTHDDATRKNIPTAEYQSVMAKDEQSPIRLAYERRNRDLDPQLVWRGKDEQDWSDLIVHAPAFNKNIDWSLKLTSAFNTHYTMVL